MSPHRLDAFWILRGNRLFLRVFWVMGSLLLAMTLLYGLLVIPLQKQALLKTMYSQASTVSKTIIQSCSDAMLTDDLGFVVEHNLIVLKNNQSLKEILFLPVQGNPIVIHQDHWEEQPRNTKELRSLQGSREESYGIVETTHENGRNTTYEYAMPVELNGIHWGWMRMRFSTSDYEQNVLQMYVQLISISLLTLAVVLPICYLFALRLTRPLSVVGDAVSRVAHGDLKVRVPLRRQDEIGVLARNFNLMVDALAESYQLLEESNTTLEHKVAERTWELDALNHTLDLRIQAEIRKREAQEQLLIHQSRLAAMGEMIGAIAHQWRQPLNALGLVLQNMGIQYREGRLTDESMQRMQDKAGQLVKRMSSTIDEFRNFFKPDNHIEPFNLLVSLRAAVDILEGVVTSHNIRIDLTCPETIVIRGVCGEFSQVVLNLLSNAKDALIGARCAEPVIRIRAMLVEDKVRIEFDDNGGGIPPAIINKIFEPYFTTKGEGKGTGIGLYMSKMIIETHMNGLLEASNLQEGARFAITVPVHQVA